MNSREKPLFKEPIFLLSMAGLYPTKYNSWRAVASVLIYGILALDIFLHLILKWQGLDSLDDTNVCIGVLQVIIKMVTLITKRSTISTVIKTINTTFWNPNKYGRALEIQINQTNKLIKIAMMASIISYNVAIVIYFLKPFVSDIKTEPVSVYYPINLNNSYNFWIIYSAEATIGAAIAIPSLLGFDFLFIALIVHVVNEFKLIKQGLIDVEIDLDENATLKEINGFIDHHITVLGCVKLLNESYSFLLLEQFLTSVFTIFICLLNIMAEGFPPAVPRLLRSFSYVSSFAGMLFLYCYAGTSLINQSQEVAFAAYESKWWSKTQPEFRKRVAMIIQRAHKYEKLTAGGMFDLRLESFTNIVRNAFSFVTLAHAVLTRQPGEDNSKNRL